MDGCHTGTLSRRIVINKHLGEKFGWPELRQRVDNAGPWLGSAFEPHNLCALSLGEGLPSVTRAYRGAARFPGSDPPAEARLAPLNPLCPRRRAQKQWNQTAWTRLERAMLR